MGVHSERRTDGQTDRQTDVQLKTIVRNLTKKKKKNVKKFRKNIKIKKFPKKFFLIFFFLNEILIIQFEFKLKFLRIYFFSKGQKFYSVQKKLLGVNNIIR
jgi:hypothetical protein